MGTSIKNTNSLVSQKPEKEIIQTNKVIEASPDPQVKIKRNYSSRRTFNVAYKLHVLSAYDACENSVTRGALLRKEGLYHSRIAAWKQQLNRSTLKGGKLSKPLRSDNLRRENEQLKKKLAQAEAIIDLQKKVSELLGTHILAPESNE